MKNNYLITVVGPTAIGKTALSIALAKHFKAEIISCDSRQFYKEMTIGTAVPSSEELAQAAHHFIQNRSVQDDYSVGQFEKDALAKLDDLFQINEVVIMVGGSGLYVNAVLNGLDYFPEVAPEIRLELNKRMNSEGIEALQKELKSKDPASYSTIEIENPHRLIRALEICIGTGKSYASFKNKPKKARNFTPLLIGLQADRQTMYNRINKRVDIMMETGLLEEAQRLHHLKHLNALQTVGYKELFAYFDNDFTLDFAISEIKKNTRRFAKRQVTWNKKDERIHWFDFEMNHDEICNKVEALMQRKVSN